MDAKLAEVLKDVSKNCLKGKAVPDILKELWRDQLNGYSFIQKNYFGQLTLVSSYSEEFFEGYDAEFIGNKLIANTYSKMFEEIGFIGSESDGGLVGYWFYKSDIETNAAPILLLDNEGMFHLYGDNLQDFFISRHEAGNGAGRVNPEIIETLNIFLKDRNLAELKSIDEIRVILSKLPDPEQRFNYYESLLG